ncbi:DUF169 domain-containing protein [Candidatus Gracilibacteria bacterium]|nr:DUF169 domain-containing protein [Candidatus Gracilibacteria bacterium]
MFKPSSKIKYLGVRFTSRLTHVEKNAYNSNPHELYCSAIAKAAKTGKKIIIDTRLHQCAGGNYFIGNHHFSQKQLIKVYTQQEKIFQNSHQTISFLRKVGKNPVKTNYLIIEPVNPEANLNIRSRYQTILIITNPAYAGRIIGLSTYKKNTGNPETIAAASTCAALFRPLLNPKVLHINFIDYFDRNYQCPKAYSQHQLILSMTPSSFQQTILAYPLSSHGKQKPDLQLKNMV